MQKNPYGYGPGHGTGVSCPIGLGVIAGTGAKAEPAGGYSAFTSIPGLVVDAHGEQNGAVYQEVTLGRVILLRSACSRKIAQMCWSSSSTVITVITAPTSTPRRTTTDAWPEQGLWSSLWGGLLTRGSSA